MKFLIIFFAAFVFLSGSIAAQNKISVEKFDWFKQLRTKNNDTTYVVNFWATWCMPCIEELPVFEKINRQYANQKVKVILVSLDFVKKLSITVQPYINKQKITSEVVLLNEPDYNSWIDKVDKRWSGSIPCTLIFNNQKKVYEFLESQITFTELNSILQNIK